jgi:hypothetical protein
LNPFAKQYCHDLPKNTRPGGHSNPYQADAMTTAPRRQDVQICTCMCINMAILLISNHIEKIKKKLLPSVDKKYSKNLAPINN